MDKKKVFNKIISGLSEAIVICICSLLIVRNTCFDAIVVNGSSMNPTLSSGDYGYCNKTLASLNNIQRFDIVIFEYDTNNDGTKEELIKRVIGLPNENVYFDEETFLYINQEKVNQNFVDYTSDEYNKNYNSFKSYAGRMFDVPEDAYFVLGDNRDNSKDSRSIGYIKKECIKGVLKVITAHYENVNDLSKGKKIIPFVYF